MLLVKLAKLDLKNSSPKEHRSRQDTSLATYPSAPHYLGLQLESLGCGPVQEAGAQLQHGDHVLLDCVLLGLLQLWPQESLDVLLQLQGHSGLGHGQG